MGKSNSFQDVQSFFEIYLDHIYSTQSQCHGDHSSQTFKGLQWDLSIRFLFPVWSDLLGGSLVSFEVVPYFMRDWKSSI